MVALGGLAGKASGVALLLLLLLPRRRLDTMVYV
jgi:hypothetical protein